MHSEQHDSDLTSCSTHVSNRPRLLIREPSDEEDFEPANHSTLPPASSPNISPHSSLSLNAGRLPGVFAHYLILRPHPSLRITFTSPSLRVPGLLQSPFLSRIGGSRRVREELALALSEGRNVTAKVRWLLERGTEPSDGTHDSYGPSSSSQPGKSRWIHCTPLLGATRAIGAWMVIMIDSEDSEHTKTSQTQRPAATNPSTSKQASAISNDTNKARSTNPREEPYPKANHQPTIKPALAPSINSSEWDLDFDLATAGPFPHPPSGTGYSSSPHTTAIITQHQDPYSTKPALASVPSPPPNTTIPPLPRHTPLAFTTTPVPRSTSLNVLRPGNNNSSQHLQPQPSLFANTLTTTTNHPVAANASHIPPFRPFADQQQQQQQPSSNKTADRTTTLPLTNTPPLPPPTSNSGQHTGNSNGNSSNNHNNHNIKPHRLAHRMLGNLLKPSSGERGKV